MKRDNQCNIKCPYYITDGDRYLTCEGVDSEIIKQRFKNRTEIIMYQRIYCEHYPNECKIAALIELKYK